MILEGIDVEEHFSSELLRRAARHLRAGSLSEPMSAQPGHGDKVDDDPALQRLLAELVVEAGREQARPAMLEVQRLQLELAWVDRQIRQARGRELGDVSDLARRRADVKRDFDRAYGRVSGGDGGEGGVSLKHERTFDCSVPSGKNNRVYGSGRFGATSGSGAVAS